MASFSFDLLRSLLWQYDRASAIRSLAEAKQSFYSARVAGFWNDWYRDVFDLRTANSFGLSVWALILDLPLAFDIPASDAVPFGFDPHGGNFDNSNFGSDVPTANPLTVEQRRLALRLRYFQLTTNATVSSINAFLLALFGDQGRAYVLDGGNMTAAYVFEFVPDPLLFMVITSLDLLPRPAGVKVTVLTSADGRGFGFSPFGQPFDQGAFAS